MFFNISSALGPKTPTPAKTWKLRNPSIHKPRILGACQSPFLLSCSDIPYLGSFRRLSHMIAQSWGLENGACAGNGSSVTPPRGLRTGLGKIECRPPILFSQDRPLRKESSVSFADASRDTERTNVGPYPPSLQQNEGIEEFRPVRPSLLTRYSFVGRAENIPAQAEEVLRRLPISHAFSHHPLSV